MQHLSPSPLPHHPGLDVRVGVQYLGKGHGAGGVNEMRAAQVQHPQADLVGIGLFGDARIRNLTLLLYDQLGAYRMGGAAVTAALLMLLIFVLYQVIERGVGGRAAP